MCCLLAHRSATLLGDLALIVKAVFVSTGTWQDMADVVLYRSVLRARNYLSEDVTAMVTYPAIKCVTWQVCADPPLQPVVGCYSTGSVTSDNSRYHARLQVTAVYQGRSLLFHHAFTSHVIGDKIGYTHVNCRLQCRGNNTIYRICAQIITGLSLLIGCHAFVTGLVSVPTAYHAHTSPSFVTVQLAARQSERTAW